MSKGYKVTGRRSSSQCPVPVNLALDLAGALAMGLYVNHKVKKDYKNGSGDSSAAAASIVCGTNALRAGTSGRIGLGGMIGLTSAMNSQARQQDFDENLNSSRVKTKKTEAKQPYKSGLWREFCEDGTGYGLNPEDFESADDYESALDEAKLQEKSTAQDKPSDDQDHIQNLSHAQHGECGKYRWRNYCEDGSQYGIYPEDYETADDYEEALEEKKKK